MASAAYQCIAIFINVLLSKILLLLQVVSASSYLTFGGVCIDLFTGYPKSQIHNVSNPNVFMHACVCVWAHVWHACVCVSVEERD